VQIFLFVSVRPSPQPQDFLSIFSFFFLSFLPIFSLVFSLNHVINAFNLLISFDLQIIEEDYNKCDLLSVKENSYSHSFLLLIFSSLFKGKTNAADF